MEIKQFEDTHLSHYSYAIISGGEMAIIDPSRDPEPYYDFAKEKGARIVAIVETHPHADFASGHSEIHARTGADIRVSALVEAEYPHVSFDEGDSFAVGGARLTALHTPGHSPDSISIVAEEGEERAVFTGDTLFIGDCGRPDLRESAGAIVAAREALARQMYHSLREKLAVLPDDTLVYPAHGAGTLCGKSLSKEGVSTIGREKETNWSLREMSEEDFVRELLAGQPFVPRYFPYEVELNKKGAPALAASLASVPLIEQSDGLDPSTVLIDARPAEEYAHSHLENSINIMNGEKFETWLGSIVNPREPYYLAASDAKELRELIANAANIGYEPFVKGAFVFTRGTKSAPPFDPAHFEKNKNAYTILDVRNDAEVEQGKIFADAVHIPLHQLRERAGEIPTDKPIVVHCAGGYRSAAGSSIVRAALGDTTPVYDMSTHVASYGGK